MSDSFVGCISDVTFNGKIINFAQLTDAPRAIIGRCTDVSLSGFNVPEFNNTMKPKPPLRDEIDMSMQAPIQQTTSSTLAPDEITTKPSAPVGLCALSVIPQIDTDVNKNSGFRFGNQVGSRFEYDSTMIKTKNDRNEISLDIKTSSTDGVIFFAYQSEGTDFMAVYLNEGKVNYQLSCNSIPMTIKAQLPVNDRNWHSINWIRSNTNAELFVDNIPVGSSLISDCKNMNSIYYLGGVHPTAYQKVIEYIGMNETFIGCLRNFKVNSKDVGSPSRKHGVTKCSEKVEEGAFFHGNGGYIRLLEKFVVGKEFEISMNIKPRSVNGILMSAQSSKKNLLMLKMINGTISFSVNTGKGQISASFTPASPYYLCDGMWHTIKAAKHKNIVRLGVDNMFTTPDQYGKVGTTNNTLTESLYLGGNPIFNNRQVNGYLGCIQNVEIVNVNIHDKIIFKKFPTQIVHGNVTLSVCPTI
uniref:Laminin subunit alpha n=2 Tax=Melanaphis sacchari TaxID=742174 RepID=A0A2H8TTK7_9HEMI